MDLETLENNHQEWLIDEFVEVANGLLPLYLPDIKGNSKVKEEINTRLVRSYASQRLMDEPIRQNRYAFYRYRHLLQLLLIKRLLSDGIGTTAINDLLTSKTNDELKSLLIGGISLNITTAHPPLQSIPNSSNSALDFLADLKGKRSQSPSTIRGNVKQKSQSSPAPNQNTMSALDETDQNSWDKEENWTRLRILDGLELHIRDDLIYPNSIKERESLMELFRNILSKFFKRRQL
ncbi:MerR family transcriptional regulator [Cyanobacterium sp. DS4]|uniref:MerR family transcriptional regulator n=1 Tax=Cyanobacterium sp. DS4 TaxID=2878255 RepID=UPI002E802BD3|nr:MerR family transcriptional regulator [Cyanobacterium sp. Dongsha4]WVL01870.1 MerR family transcriptional regulator [Cyanobacterium sp. Dongsha4]